MVPALSMLDFGSLDCIRVRGALTTLQRGQIRDKTENV